MANRLVAPGEGSHLCLTGSKSTFREAQEREHKSEFHVCFEDQKVKSQKLVDHVSYGLIPASAERSVEGGAAL